MALSGWNEDQKLKLTIDGSKIEGDLTDFPVNITLSSGTGITGFDTADVFDKLTEPVASGTSFLFQTAMDSSDSYHSITTNGNPSLYSNTTLSGLTGNMYFDGAGDYLTAANHADFDFGTDDMSVDCWVKFADWPVNNNGYYVFMLVCKDAQGSRGLSFAISGGTSPSTLDTIGFGDAAVSEISGSYTFSLDTWYHVAVTRESSYAYLFVNGQIVGEGAQTSMNTNTVPLKVGANVYGSGYNYYLNGYMSELRISRGIARWTSAFTPPTEPYIPDEYTKLLLHFYGDRSDYKHSITHTDDIICYSLSNNTMKGYYYFFGSDSHYLSVPDSPAWHFDSGDFTISLWVNFHTMYNYDTFMCQRTSDNSDRGWHLGYNNVSNALEFKYATSTGGWTDEYYPSWTASTGSWYYVTIVRDGNTIHAYIDGVEIGAGHDCTGDILVDCGQPLIIGKSAYAGEYLKGYMAEIEIVKGTAKWTSDFEVPYGPALTSTANRKQLVITDVNDNKLYTEIAYWDDTNQTASLWTKIPTVSSGTDTELTLYYDGTSSGTLVYGNYSFTHASNVNSPNRRNTCVYMSPNGTKMYTSGSYADSVYEYTLSTAWDVTTASYVGLKAVGSQDTVVYGIAWKTDGTKMYVTGNNSYYVHQYTASTPWSVTSTSFQSSYTGGGGQGLSFNSTGNKMIVAGDVYSLSNPWDVTTASLVSTYGNVICLSDDGVLLFRMSGQKIYQYTLSTPWDLSSRVYEGLIVDTTSEVSLSSGFCTIADVSKFFVVDSNLDADGKVHRYSGVLIPKYIGDTGEVAARKVWDSNFAGVWHMEQSPTGSILDSTSNSNDGATLGSMTNDDLIDGKVGKALDFDGSDDYINVGDSSAFDCVEGTGDFTLSALVKVGTLGDPSKYGIVDHHQDDTHRWHFGLRSTSISFAGREAVGGTWHQWVNTSTTSYIDTDYEISVTRGGGSTWKVYKNGDLLDTIGDSTGVNSVTGGLSFGSMRSSDIYYDGVIDEVRLSSSTRSDVWAKATYESNWNNLVTFTDQFDFANFIFSSVSPDSTTVYGTTEPLYINVSVSGSEPSYAYDASFYTSLGVQIGSTVSGAVNGSQVTRTVPTPSGTDYDWYVTATASGFNDTSATYTFTNKFLCGGYVTIDDVPASGVPVRLYLRDTGEMIGEDVSSTVSGTFTIETDYNDYHYAIALRDASNRNAQIADWLIP